MLVLGTVRIPLVGRPLGSGGDAAHDDPAEPTRGEDRRGVVELGVVEPGLDAVPVGVEHHRVDVDPAPAIAGTRASSTRTGRQSVSTT